MPKNEIVRERGEHPGEAGADWSFGSTAKPEADEHYLSQKKGGLRGPDMQQPALRDQTGTMREPIKGEPAETQRSPHQEGQSGADVRGSPPMVQGSDPIEQLPEGLRRERKGPYDRNVGRAEAAKQVPKNWPGKQ